MIGESGMETFDKKQGFIEFCSEYGSKKWIPFNAKIYCIISVIVPFSISTPLNCDVNRQPAYVTKVKVKSAYWEMKFCIL